MKTIAFDCFGTIFDMSTVDRKDVEEYANHVNKKDFSEYSFNGSWWELKCRPFYDFGIKKLQSFGFTCIALSNGGKKLISTISLSNGIYWDHIVDLPSHGVYKPHIEAYKAVQIETGISPKDTIMVTANPSFGDLEGSSKIGMTPVVIGNYIIKNINELANILILKNAG